MIFSSKKSTIKLPQSIQLNTQISFIKTTNFIDFSNLIIFATNDIKPFKNSTK